ncbi:hypothetical protein JKP88DRAFT_260837 [Tribonema minus]|uniref:DNA primase n=1 Tax=Tribonema minus TaxID=303371 RepID=A0A836CNE6_9STRA|nr:hypothetical protein JKP88DRAFT_260837 [Tribonema minus]
MAADDGPSFSEELLRVYYQRLFPYDQMWRWLCYGNDPLSSSGQVDKTYINRREMSFTIANDIYIRYQCFKDKADMVAQIQKMQPHKMDIGAVFSVPPRDHATVKAGAFKPVERELVFDIDLTDYDDVRTCCSGAKVCGRCWGYMAMAMKVMDASLRDDFGFKHILWVFSGRRGVHCWVCDDNARRLPNDARSAVAAYLSVVAGGEGKGKKVASLTWPLHHALQRAYDALEPMFRENIIGEDGQGLLADPENWRKLLRTIPYDGVADDLDASWQAAQFSQTPEQRWQEAVSAVMARADKEAQRQRNKKSKTASSGGSGGGEEGKGTATSGYLWKYEAVFTHAYPRLDVNVSTHMNHLLKSPFVAHPKTGRVCVPINCARAEEFDPFSVPTLGQLVAEIDANAASQSSPGSGDSGGADIERTSLHKYVQCFEASFLRPLSAAIRKAQRDAADREAAVTVDF